MSSSSPSIVIADRHAPETWDDYVNRNEASSVYHLKSWLQTLAGTFGLEVFYLHAESADGDLIGLLPLIRQRSLFFGDRLTSLPFVNYGSVLADNASTRSALLDRAIELGRGLNVDRIELRDTVPAPQGWSCRRDKVALRLSLPPSVDELTKGFGSKLRSQVKRAGRDPYETQVGSADRVEDFYPVFAEVMRDLGTPVYPRRFFEQLACRLVDYCTILTIHRAGRPVSAAFLVGYRTMLEIPWAATVAAEKPKATNMLLYAEVIKLALERGFTTFDFGRSTVDSGPYRFKLQWGAKPVQLHWAIWPPEGEARDRPVHSTLMSSAARLWSKLPLPLANRLGPRISPSLPW